MKVQWSLIFGLAAALIIAVFAVINVEAVKVNYLFGVAEWPLILVILGSVLMGGIIIGGVGMVRIYKLQLELKRLRQDKRTIIEVDNVIEASEAREVQQADELK